MAVAAERARIFRNYFPSASHYHPKLTGASKGLEQGSNLLAITFEEPSNDTCAYRGTQES
jgi:hypothetical protein